MEFDFDILNRAGGVHQAADALSRVPTMKADRNAVEDDLPIQCMIETEADEIIIEPEPHAYNELEGKDIYANFPSSNKDKMPTMSGFITVQTSDPVCRQLAKPVGEPGTHYEINDNSMLVRKEIMDGALHKLVSVGPE